MTEPAQVSCWYLKLTCFTSLSILIATYSVHSNVSIKAMVHGIQRTGVWEVARRLFHLLNTMYSLTLTTIIWMIYGVSLSISHSTASWWHMVWTLLFFLAFRQGRAVIKNSFFFFFWLPLNVCQHFYFILCHSSYGLLKDLIFFGSLSQYIFPCPIGRECGS